MAPRSPSVAAAGLAYWRARARELGPRAVLSTDHDGPVDDVTATHRALLLPEVAARLALAPSRPALSLRSSTRSAGASPGGRSRTVLDLGCGTGRLTGDLAALAGRAIGVDPVDELLVLAPAAPGVEYRRLTSPDGRLPLADGEADVAFTCLVLGGLDDAALARVGEELARVLAPGGLVVLAESVSARAALEHWTFRSVAAYAAALPWAGLRPVAGFDDAGDAVTVLAGRKPSV